MFSRCHRTALLGPLVAVAISTAAMAAPKLQVIYNFAGGSGDGANPVGPLLIDDRGSLYGTTTNGGSADDGTIFKISRRGQESVLHVFTGTSGDGSHPLGGVIADQEDNIEFVQESFGSEVLLCLPRVHAFRRSRWSSILASV